MTKEAKTRSPRRKTVILTPEAAQAIERVATDLEMTHKAVNAEASEIASNAIIQHLARSLGQSKLREARARMEAIQRAIGEDPEVE